MDNKTKAELLEIEAACDRLENCVHACRRRMKELSKGANSEALERLAWVLT